MKLLLKSLCVSFVITVLFSMIPFSAQCEDISGEVFRLHILANSDSQSDQDLKLKVRNRVLSFTEELYKNAPDLNSAEELTFEKLRQIADVAKDEVIKNGYDYSVRAEIGNMSFDTRYYGRVTMPAGRYDALRITIGEGKGHNWWCVMYPSLCVGAAADYDELRDKTSGDSYDTMTGGYTIKFKIVEFFEKICNIFS